MIQREAYRLITEALAAKGIHYAHKKVIVEIDPYILQSAKDAEAVGANGEDTPQKKVVEAMGAAAMAAINADEEKARNAKEN